MADIAFNHQNILLYYRFLEAVQMATVLLVG